MRKSKSWSQERFIEELEKLDVQIARNTISAVENGKEKKFTLELLLACCKLFHCDMGYLLGEYGDCSTYDRQHIHEVTGLSGANVERLVAFCSSAQDGTTEAAKVFGVHSEDGDPINSIIGDLGITVANDVMDAFLVEKDIFGGYLEILHAYSRLSSDEKDDPLLSAAKASTAAISGYEAIPLKEYIRFEIDRVTKAIGNHLVGKYIGDGEVSN